MVKIDPAQLPNALGECPEITAAYLFGSSIENGQMSRDVDILVLLSPDTNKNAAYFDIIQKISTKLCIPMKAIDLLFFDLGEADPEVLYRAVSRGNLILNRDPEYLTDILENLSRFFTQNEFYIKEARNLRKERTEAFCEN